MMNYLKNNWTWFAATLTALAIIVLWTSVRETYVENKLHSRIKSLEAELVAHGLAHGVTNAQQRTNPTAYLPIPAHTNAPTK